MNIGLSRHGRAPVRDTLWAMHAPHEYADIPGQRLSGLAGLGGLRLEISQGQGLPEDPTRAAEIERRWGVACRANPRLRDGEILSVTTVDAELGVIGVVRSTFKRLVVQDATLDLGVRLLGVKGLIVARDGAGHEHVLIGRRGVETRVYGGMWEIAPAGGVDVPHVAAVSVGEQVLRDALADEAEEELGLSLEHAPDGARAVAIVRDDVARSVDVIMRVDWPTPVDGPAQMGLTAQGARANAWEYAQTALLARRDAAEFDLSVAREIVGPMRIVLRWLGWTGASGSPREGGGPAARQGGRS